MFRYALPGGASRPLHRSWKTTGRSLCAATVAVLLLGSRVATAQTQDDIAEQLNDEGKQLMLNRNPAEAGKRFSDAAARSPNPRYFYNLCKANHFQGLFVEAMAACASARKNRPDAELSAKISDLEDNIRAAAKEQNIDLSNPAPTPDTDPPERPGPDQPAPVTPAAQPQPPRGVPPKDLYATAAPSHAYVWNLGADFVFGSASIDTRGNFGTSFSGVRVRGDLMLIPSLAVGAQGYVDVLQVSARGSSELSLVDFGVAGYKHFCRSALCVTPLLGVHAAGLDDAALGDNTFESGSFGARVELAVSYSLGTRYEHVIGAQVGLLAYSKPSDSETLGFNRGGTLRYIGIGYTRRFDTPFGSAPILGLE